MKFIGQLCSRIQLSSKRSLNQDPSSSLGSSEISRAPVSMEKPPFFPESSNAPEIEECQQSPVPGDLSSAGCSSSSTQLAPQFKRIKNDF
ncbi:hypothetical protein H5410_017965 [Solanum commersonii]|uniref:Uncharacterized protein n=1 Tax=Solanum commersonii TaxID=4109 RepID=A0A9J6A0N9_SOLCO|nr:hypothetical protein H5410_017965 [Solanum commersonii]